ncbi:EF-hand domain-containing protein [Vannielia litorea]|uniref:EF-hand domain-containing protein n=1 Tax=Vannielia litorea TaxID=1217970 RepID=UPI001FD107FF|nr:EF-hand domain-containing protein [Vannielia litorea]
MEDILMKRTTVAAIAIAALGAVALPVFADANHGHGNERGGPRAGVAEPGYPGMMGQGMMGTGMMDGGMGNMMRMMQMMHGQQGGMMGDGGMMGGADHVLRLLDSDGDGIVSPDEFRTGMQAEHAKYDADGNGSLSLAEFETMHAAHVREATVDRFQVFDADGDGQVTADEIGAPADRMERMMRMWTDADDGTMPMAGERGSRRMMGGDSNMMDGN